MKNFFILTIFCFFLISCQNLQNVEKTEKKNMTKGELKLLGELIGNIIPKLQIKSIEYTVQK